MQLEETWEYKGEIGFETTAGQYTSTVQEVKDYCENAGLNKSESYGGNSGIGEPWSDLPNIETEIDIDTYFEDNFDKCAEYYFYNVIQK